MTVGAGPGPAAATLPRRHDARSRRPRRRRTATLRDRVEYVVLGGSWALSPRFRSGSAFRVAEAVALLVYWLAAPLRRVGLINLAIAFPERAARRAQAHPARRRC